ncbi:hypothetical protein GCM10020258_07720 [Sphingomonas yabuuchiae]
MLRGLHDLAVVHALVDQPVGGITILRPAMAAGNSAAAATAASKDGRIMIFSPVSLEWVKGYVPIARHASNPIRHG